MHTCPHAHIPTCIHACSLARETAIVSLSLCNSADDGRRRFQVHMYAHGSISMHMVSAYMCTWQHLYAHGVRIHVRVAADVFNGVSIHVHRRFQVCLTSRVDLTLEWT